MVGCIRTRELKPLTIANTGATALRVSEGKKGRAGYAPAVERIEARNGKQTPSKIGKKLLDTLIVSDRRFLIVSDRRFVTANPRA